MARHPLLLHVLIAISVLANVGLAILINVVTSDELPPFLQLVKEHQAVLLGGLVLAYLAVTVALHQWTQPSPARATQEAPGALGAELRAELLAVLARMVQARLDSTLQLEEQVRLTLGLTRIPGAVTPRWRHEHLYGPIEDQPIPAEATLAQVFDQVGGQLLILGNPGAGKTTLLLELARELLARARQDPAHPVPVVVNLASWADRQAPLAEWLESAVKTASGLSLEHAARLVTSGQLLPLLDGLDEVRPDKRAACIDAINEYVASGLVKLAVTSRTHEYQQAAVKLHTSGAVRIEPLDVDQVMQQLTGKAASVRAAIQADASLRELVETPLMLHIALAAYGDDTAVWVKRAAPGERRDALYAAYLRRTLRQRKLPASCPPGDALRWLGWLASKMHARNMTELLLERLQPTWLPSQATYRVLVGATFAVLFGVIFGASVGVFAWGVEGPLDLGLSAALIAALLVGLVAGFSNSEIKPEERLAWSWRQMLSLPSHAGLGKKLIHGLVECSIYSGLIGVAAGVFAGLRAGVIAGVIAGPALGLFFGLWAALQRALAVAPLERTLTPNQGIRASLRNGIFRGLFFGLVGGLIVGVSYGWLLGMQSGMLAGLQGGLYIGMLFAVCFGLVSALFGGPYRGLGGGLGAYLQHHVLRFLLVRRGYMPWHYVAFLEQACQMLWLHRDGGVYRFHHITLRDYFARLTPAEIEALAGASSTDRAPL